MTQIPGGILAGKFGTKKILVPGLLIASACNLLSPVAAQEHPYLLLGLTLLRGMAQVSIPFGCHLQMKPYFQNLLI